MNTRSAVLLLAAVLLLPACTAHFGDNIRNAAQVRLDVDRSEQFRCGDDVLAAECSYHYMQPLISSIWHADHYAFTDLKRTGDYRVLLPGEEGAASPRLGERRPAGTPGLDKLRPGASPPVVGPGVSSERRRGPWYPLALLAAAPFDLVIDPALSVILTPPYLLMRACGIAHHLPLTQP